MSEHSSLAAADVRRIAVVRALPGLGDFLVAVPAWRALQRAFPAARISLIGLPETAGLVRRFGAYLDQLLDFPGYPGIVERRLDVRRLASFLDQVHGEPADLAIQMHGSGAYSNPFTLLLGARQAAGFYLPGQLCPAEATFLPYPAELPEVWRYLRLLEHLGVAHDGPGLEFPLHQLDRRRAQDLQRENGLVPGSYVCLHPGASEPARWWPAARFAEVGTALRRLGLQVVLTGTAAERPLTRAVSEAMGGRALDLAGRTDLGTLAALIDDARLVICNDTGVSHLADALHTPSVVIFLRSDPARWAPLDRAKHRIVFPRDENGRPDALPAGTGAAALRSWNGLPDAANSGRVGQVMPAEVLAEAAALLDVAREPVHA